MTMFAFVLFLFLFPAGAEAGVVKISAKPNVIYIERSEAAQHLNFDFLLDNQTGEKLLIKNIELSVFDDSGKLARREFVNEYSRSSLELTPKAELESKRTALIFNPFHSFAPSVPLRKLHYEFTFTTEDRKTEFKSEITVSPVPYETKTNLILPVKGRLLIWDGHDYNSHHRRFDYSHPTFQKYGQKTNFQRYGYDFVLVDERGGIYRGKPKNSDDWYQGKLDNNQDYYGFGASIHATGDGRVAAVHDGDPDNRRFNPAELATRETAYGGNYVVIDHLNGEYSWFGHLQQGSVKVKVGQRVKQGEVIAQMGASGSSLFPHLHYELRNGVGAREVEGLPSYFTNFRRLLGSRKVLVRRGQIDTGDLIEQNVGRARK